MGLTNKSWVGVYSQSHNRIAKDDVLTFGTHYTNYTLHTLKA